MWTCSLSPRKALDIFRLADLPEQIETISDELDPLFEHGPDKAAAALGDNAIAEWAFERRCDIDTELNGFGELATWQIRSLRPMPEGFLTRNEKSRRSDTAFVLLLYEVLADFGNGAEGGAT